MNVVSGLGSVNWIAVLLAVVVHTVLGVVWFAGLFAWGVSCGSFS